MLPQHRKGTVSDFFRSYFNLNVKDEYILIPIYRIILIEDKWGMLYLTSYLIESIMCVYIKFYGMNEPIKNKVGRPKLFPRKMNDAEKMSLSRMRVVAEIEGMPVEEMESYNVFKPEREAREFVDMLIKSEGNMNKTVRSLYPSYKNQSPEIVFKKGVDICKALRVQELIKQAMDKETISVDSIVSGIYDISKNAFRDADKLKALELLGKFKAMFNEKPTVQNTEYNLNISEDAARRLLERRDKYDIGPAGKFQSTSSRQEDSSCIDGEEVLDGLHDIDAE